MTWLKDLGHKPPGDDHDPHEDNTFGLPDGRPIRRALKRVFAHQAEAVLGSIPTIGAPLPDVFASLTDYNDPMAAAMTPLISAYYDWGGKKTLAKLGLDTAEWRVIDPNLHKVIAEQAMAFCNSTNATTTLKLNQALAKLRSEFHSGLVTHGETIPQLRERVLSIFTGLRKDKAEAIARTEASRAIHAASMMSAGESGVVEGKKWLASAHSCEFCLAEASRTKDAEIPLGDIFIRRGDNPIYSGIKCPPLHPHCRCTLVYVLTAEYRQIVEGEGGTAPQTVSPFDPQSPAVRRRKAA